MSAIESLPVTSSAAAIAGLARVEEAAEYLRVSRSSIYEMMDSGFLEFVKIPGIRARRIPWNALQRIATSPCLTRTGEPAATRVGDGPVSSGDGPISHSHNGA